MKVGAVKHTHTITVSEQNHPGAEGADGPGGSAWVLLAGQDMSFLGVHLEQVKQGEDLPLVGEIPMGKAAVSLSNAQEALGISAEHRDTRPQRSQQ